MTTIAMLIFIIILLWPDTTTTRSLPRGGTPVPYTWRTKSLAWMGAALAGAVAVPHVFLETQGLGFGGATALGMAASWFIAAVCAAGAVLVGSRRATVVLLAVAVVPLLIGGLWFMGSNTVIAGPPLFLAAGFLITALVKVVSQS